MVTGRTHHWDSTGCLAIAGLAGDELERAKPCYSPGPYQPRRMPVSLQCKMNAN